MTDPTPGKPLVLVTAAFNRQLAAELPDACEVVYVEPDSSGRSLADAGLDELLARASVIVAELDRVDEATLAKAPHVKLVVACRAAPVNIDIPACTRRGIPVATTPARNADCTADLAFALLLSTVRQTSRAEAWMRTGAWTEQDPFYPYENFRGMTLRGHTLGILGGGAVGSRMLARARGFGMNVQVYDPYLPLNAFGDQAQIVDLPELMRSSDVVSVHVPLNPATVGLVTAEHIAMMKPSAYFIMAGRAATVDEAALMEALRNQRIAGAGFDVYWREPLPVDSELFGLPNVTLTPHIAGASDGVVDEQTRIATAAILDWHAGRTPRAVANAADLGLN
jgi:phosphoglycerate dehydrogenase-like enzyme